MKQKHWIAIVLALCLLLALFPANVFAEDGEPEGRVYLETYTTGYVGQIGQVSWRVEPYDFYSELKELVSSDPTVIEVTDWNDVKYLSPGTAILTLTLENGLTDSVTVTVKETPAFPSLELGIPFEVTLNSRDFAVYSFTPEESGDYVYYASCADAILDYYGFYEAGDRDAVSQIGSKMIEDLETKSIYLEAGKNYYFVLKYMGGIDQADSYTGTACVMKRPDAESIEFTKSTYVIYCTPGPNFVFFPLELVVEPAFSFVFGEYSKLELTLSDPDIMLTSYNPHYSLHTLLPVSPGRVTVTATLDGRSASCEYIILADKYTILEGDRLEISDENLGNAAFRADGELELFTGVYVDGQFVDPANYTATSGSTIITFAPEYLRTLATGNHTLIIAFGEECAHTTFSIALLSDPEPTPSAPEEEETTPSAPSEEETTPTAPNEEETTPTTPSEEETIPSVPNEEETTPTTPSEEETTPTTPSEEETTPSAPNVAETTPSAPGDSESPKTGDNSLIPMLIFLFASIVGSTALLLTRKKYI